MSCKNTKYLFSLLCTCTLYIDFPKKLRHFLCITVSKYKTRSFVNNFKQNILKLYTSVKCKCDWCDSNVFLLNLSNVKYINRFSSDKFHKKKYSQAKWLRVALKKQTSKEYFRRRKSWMSGFRKCEYSQVFAGNDEYPLLVQKPSCRTKVWEKRQKSRNWGKKDAQFQLKADRLGLE